MSLKKTDVEGLYRDVETRAVLNVDNSSLEAYKKRKRANEEFVQYKKKIEQIDNDINEIKNILKSIVEKI